MKIYYKNRLKRMIKLKEFDPEMYLHLCNYGLLLGITMGVLITCFIFKNFL